VLLVLLFFSVFLHLLNLIFPYGTSLRQIVSQQGSLQQQGLAVAGDREMMDAAAGQKRELAATLAWTRNSVKSKGAYSIAWQSAEAGRELYDRDAVQTLERSAAEIRFDESTNLAMGENSLLIIKHMGHDPVYREKRSFMVLVDGDLRGHLSGAGTDAVHLEIGTPGAMVKTQSGPGAGGPVDFKISINPDQSSTIAVYGGTAQVIANGQTVTVGENQATLVRLGDGPLAPGQLPDRVRPSAPSTGGIYVYRDLPPKVKFAWNCPTPVSGYHFVLARDPGFHDIVTDEVVGDQRFSHGNLKKGSYYWKVSARKESFEGLFSEPRRFQVVQDETPPVLNVQFPPDTIRRGWYMLNGKTEPGARVFVDGKRVLTSRSGRFEYRLKLQPGMNVIVVEAVDTVDNVAYKSKRVISKY
jgi:hypothetical protein